LVIAATPKRPHRCLPGLSVSHTNRLWATASAGLTISAPAVGATRAGASASSSGPPRGRRCGSAVWRGRPPSARRRLRSPFRCVSSLGSWLHCKSTAEHGWPCESTFDPHTAPSICTLLPPQERLRATCLIQPTTPSPPVPPPPRRALGRGGGRRPPAAPLPPQGAAG